MKELSLKKALEWMMFAQVLRALNGMPVIGGLFGLAAVILNLIALFSSRKEDKGYLVAFWLNILGIAVEMLGAAVDNEGILGMLISMAAALVNLAMVYFVCMATVRVLDYAGEEKEAEFGGKVWKTNLICTIISLVLVVILAIPTINLLGSITLILLVVAQLVSCVMLIVFFYRSCKAL